MLNQPASSHVKRECWRKGTRGDLSLLCRTERRVVPVPLALVITPWQFGAVGWPQGLCRLETRFPSGRGKWSDRQCPPAGTPSFQGPWDYLLRKHPHLVAAVQSSLSLLLKKKICHFLLQMWLEEPVKNLDRLLICDWLPVTGQVSSHHQESRADFELQLKTWLK